MQAPQTEPRADEVVVLLVAKASDGKHVGTVLAVEHGRLRLASRGMDNDIDIELIDAIKGETVRLRQTAQETVRSWH